MTVNIQDSKEASKKRKTQDNEVENTYTRKLRKRRKKISYNQVNRRGGDITKDPSYIATKDGTDKVPTLGGGSISTKGRKTVIGTKELSNLRKIHDSQVDTSRTNLDASTQSNTITNDRSTTNMSDKVQNDRNSSLANQTIGNLADIDNSARLLERNAPVNTELINNLVIRMSGSISSGNNKNSPSISTFQVPVPELPKIPAFEPESPNVAIDDDSVVSQITDFNFNEDKNESMTTDSIFDFFSYPQYMKKYIPSKIARETATDLVDFKNQ